MRIQKRGECEYRGIHAQSGTQALTVEWSREIGNRPDGEFVIYETTLRAVRPIEADISISVDHRCTVLWLSRSRLFEIPWPIPEGPQTWTR